VKYALVPMGAAWGWISIRTRGQLVPSAISLLAPEDVGDCDFAAISAPAPCPLHDDRTNTATPSAPWIGAAVLHRMMKRRLRSPLGCPG
jgi:hypothetical protein